MEHKDTQLKDANWLYLVHVTVTTEWNLGVQEILETGVAEQLVVC